MVGRARISTGLRVAVADADEQVGRCLVVEEPACGVVFLRASEYRHRISLVQRIAVVDTDREGREVVAQRAARDADEKEGRLRRAQLLEAVLVANEPLGELAKRRAEIEKLFADNGNIVNGSVIAGLEKMGIAHKDGDKYLLPCEIIKRNY